MKHRILNYLNSSPSGGRSKLRPISRLLKNACLSFAFCCFTLAGFAQTWLGITGDWQDPNNWTPTLVPTASNTTPIVLSAGTPIDVTTIPATVSGSKLTILQNITLPSGVTFNITGAIGNGDGVEISGVTLTLSAGATLNVSNAEENGIELMAANSNLINSGMISINGTDAGNTATGYHGIFIGNGTNTVTNNNILTIRNVDNVNTPGNGVHIQNGTFINSAVGQMRIDTIGGHGILNNNIFTNNGHIAIDSTNADNNAGSLGHGIFNTGVAPVFTNTSTGTITIFDIPGGSNGILHAAGDFKNAGTITINDIMMDGIQTNASFCNEGTLNIANLVNDEIGIRGIHEDGIDVMSGTFTNRKTGIINISGLTTGSGAGVGVNGHGIRLSGGSVLDSNIVIINGVSDDGIHVMAGTYTQEDTAELTIQHVGLNGINVLSSAANMFTSNASIIRIPTGVVMNGINNQGVFLANNGALIEIGVGGTTGAIGIAGIANGATFQTDDKGTKIVLDNATTFSINNTAGTFTNNVTVDGDAVIIETNDGINVGGGSITNQSIMLMNGPLGASQGSAGGFTNTGLVSDLNGSLLTVLNSTPTRTFNPVVNNAGNGLIIEPFLAMCRDALISDYIFTTAVFDVNTAMFLPSANWTMAGSPAATLNLTTTANELTLLTGLNIMTLDFEVLANGASCNVFGQTSFAFDRGNAGSLACNSNVQISLNVNCIAKINPDMILEDDGGCTNGYVVRVLEGSKAGTDTVDATYIGQTVQVMVTDPSGVNSCWGTVTIEDKLAPTLTSRDTFIYCTQDRRPELLGFPTAVDACGGTVSFTYADSEQVGANCGVDPSNPDTMSTIVRVFTGRDASGNASTDTQRIYVLRPTMADVRIPASFTGSNALQCSNAQTDPAITGRPFFVISGDTILVEAICKFGVDLDERTFSLGCTGKSRIVRTWTIWDWCHITAGNAVAADTQVIDIVDTIAPTFDSIRASEIVVLSMQAHKCMATIKPPLPTSMQDACSGTTFRILGPTGTIYNNPLDSFINVPLDTHTLEYIVSDSCGNEARDTITFILQDNTAPLALAQELTVNLVDGSGNTWVYASSFDAGSTDNCSGLDSILISKDGVNFAERVAFDCSDIGTQTLTLKIVDNVGLSSTATREVQIQDTGGFCGAMACNTGVMIDTAFMMVEPSNCDTRDGELIVVATTNGANIEYSLDSGVTYQGLSVPFVNQDTSLKYIFVREIGNPTCVVAYKGNPIQPEGGCVSLTANATIAGHIQNENGELVEAVNINIGGYEMAPEVTGANGTFMFEEIPLDGDYMITPEKDMNYGNGITTFDIVLLSKHVLGLKPLDSPYKLIAADVNNSGSISAYDMVLLRQVILGVKNDFPNNTSWRFIDANYEFLRPENPFIEDYPEVYEINSLATDMMTLDFVAVKIGDVNNSASANQLMSAESRNTHQSLNFQVAEQVKEAGETITVDFKSSNFQAILGYQFTLDFNGNALDFEQLLIGEKAGFENFNLSMIQRGMITTSWSQAEAMNLTSDEVLFSIVFKAKENIRLSEVIQISSAITAAEAYTATEEVINVNLDIHESTANIAGFKLYQNKPNPFTGETIIGFDLPIASATTMTIFDMSGKVVKVISESYEKGYHQIAIDGKDFNEQGMFYYQLATTNGIETKKMILLKQ